MKRLKIKLIRSTAKKLKNHKACVLGLGLRKIGSEVEVWDTPENRGMIKRVEYLLQVKEVGDYAP